MSDTITRHNLFRPEQPKPPTKAEITNSTARAIIQAEAERREAKSRRLRQARLEMEALKANNPIPAKGSARKTAKPVSQRRTPRRDQ